MADQKPAERAGPGASAGGARSEPDPDTPMVSFRRMLARLWKDERPHVAIPRDIVVVGAVLIIVLAGLWTYTGQPFPDTSPLVVIESGSMMHPDSPYGHVGTIDPGDLVLVRTVDSAGDVETAYGPDDRTGYGGRGDVIVYRPDGRFDATPIIHRALTYVEVIPFGPDPNTGQESYRYTYYDEAGRLHEEVRGVTLESVGIRDMRPSASGFVTKGDNPNTNRMADQVTHVPGRLVELDWIIGKARGEIAWLGLVKLAMTGNPVPTGAEIEGQCPFLRAWAPCDMWVMLAASLVVLIAVPVGLDKWAKRDARVRRWLW